MNSNNKIQLELIVDTCSNGTYINNRKIILMLKYWLHAPLVIIYLTIKNCQK